MNTSSVSTSVVGSALKVVDGLPSVIFHRDGSTSSDMEIYMSSSYRVRPAFSVVTVTRSTGRSELYRLSGTGTGATWQVTTS